MSKETAQWFVAPMWTGNNPIQPKNHRQNAYVERFNRTVRYECG